VTLTCSPTTVSCGPAQTSFITVPTLCSLGAAGADIRQYRRV